MKYYAIYGNNEPMCADWEIEYDFELFIGTGKQLKEVCRDLFDNENDEKYCNCLEFFQREWLDGNCKEYALRIDRVNGDTGEDLKCPIVHLLAQEHLKIYKYILRDVPVGRYSVVHGWYADKWDEAKKAIFGEVE